MLSDNKIVELSLAVIERNYFRSGFFLFYNNIPADVDENTFVIPHCEYMYFQVISKSCKKWYRYPSFSFFPTISMQMQMKIHFLVKQLFLIANVFLGDQQKFQKMVQMSWTLFKKLDIFWFLSFLQQYLNNQLDISLNYFNYFQLQNIVQMSWVRNFCKMNPLNPLRFNVAPEKLRQTKCLLFNF